MSTANVTALAGGAPPTKPLSTWEFWGRVLVVPYLIVFVVFVVYPVCYGLWLARDPQSYVKLAADPIFFRTAVNTIVFLVIAINLKMVVALMLSGFFIKTRWWIKILSVLFILPWAVPSIPTILSVRFMLNPEAELFHPDAHLEVAALLDAHPAGRPHGHSAGAVRGRVRRWRQCAAEVPLHHLAVDALAVPDLADPLHDLDPG